MGAQLHSRCAPSPRHVARDFDTLIRTRYAELAKAENEEQIEALVNRFRTRFAGDDALAQAVSIYESLSSVEPELSDEGNAATYRLEGRFVKLSRMADGRWGFHV
jgi:hypothetical protein